MSRTNDRYGDRSLSRPTSWATPACPLLRLELGRAEPTGPRSNPCITCTVIDMPFTMRAGAGNVATNRVGSTSRADTRQCRRASRPDHPALAIPSVWAAWRTPRTGGHHPKTIDAARQIARELVGTRAAGRLVGFFDAFQAERGWEAHLNGRIAAALMGKASKLLPEARAARARQPSVRGAERV